MDSIAVSVWGMAPQSALRGGWNKIIGSRQSHITIDMHVSSHVLHNSEGLIRVFQPGSCMMHGPLASLKAENSDALVIIRCEQNDA